MCGDGVMHQLRLARGGIPGQGLDAFCRQTGGGHRPDFGIPERQLDWTNRYHLFRLDSQIPELTQRGDRTVGRKIGLGCGFRADHGVAVIYGLLDRRQMFCRYPIGGDSDIASHDIANFEFFRW